MILMEQALAVPHAAEGERLRPSVAVSKLGGIRTEDPAQSIAASCSATFSVSVVASLLVSVCATGKTPPVDAGRGLVFRVSSGCSFC